MPRRLRHTLQGAAFHVINRAVRCARIFETPADYRAFLKVASEGTALHPVKVIAYCVMPTHWHFVVLGDRIPHVSKWMHWLAGTHASRWHAAHGTRGTGHLYQDRFRAVPIQMETSLLRVCRYVERNALRKGLVGAAEDWEWGSLYACSRNCHAIKLEPWPILKPADWIQIVNTPENEAELEALRNMVRRNQPIGEPDWQKAVAPFVGLTMRPIGRPRKRSPTP
jgi:putative transposase